MDVSVVFLHTCISSAGMRCSEKCLCCSRTFHFSDWLNYVYRLLELLENFQNSFRYWKPVFLPNVIKICRKIANWCLFYLWCQTCILALVKCRISLPHIANLVNISQNLVTYCQLCDSVYCPLKCIDPQWRKNNTLIEFSLT